ncbi:NUDIX domain-containing protein [Echinicola vietnamensis]|uniref:ADP-ribose pyrophosphatase n=1 Tax=Echinicola vietnamensis (strain DSM 17526 / LMG 23754 / KMM 6221) TaxID=926556 RepID=L0FVT8_ECHVK|nr:NUDIX domain-containing protein [Echinicola vietnamensis]AGA76785.1 ADP-ribose pyrophosphatase [Echinicola vietnamensis DSM 17526]
MHSIYPEPTVGAIIFNPRGEVLLCKSAKWNDQYVIPGGHIEKGEQMETALVREVKEETGLDVYDLQLVSVQESVNSDHFSEKRHFIFIDFTCRTDQYDVVLNDEADEYAWVKPSAILDYDLGGFCRYFFEEWLKEASDYKRGVFYGYVKK